MNDSELPLIRARDLFPPDDLPKLVGPRKVGPHKHVFDRLMSDYGYWTWCADCHAEWPEGGPVRSKCEPFAFGSGT